MFRLKWSESSGKKAGHPMADAAQAARLLEDLPRDNPGKALLEASAWLESIESEAGFSALHRLNLAFTIEEAVEHAFEELTLAYCGARVGAPAQPSDWRTLMDFSDRLTAIYVGTIDLYAERKDAELKPRMPLLVVRCMRAITRSMKVSCMRYLPPDLASWEGLVRAYRTALAHGFAQAPVRAHDTDVADTSAQQELAVGVMFVAAAPQSLPPRQIQIAWLATVNHRADFTVTSAREEQWRHYLFDLQRPAPPARIPDQVAPGGGLLFFSAEEVLPQLTALTAEREGLSFETPADRFGGEFGPSEVRAAAEHLLRFWDDSPPSRRDERRRVTTKIQVELGVAALQRALTATAEGQRSEGPAIALEGAAVAPAAEPAAPVVAVNTWTLTDFSTRGIGARVVRRLDGWLKVGTLLAFRLERSDKWCVAIVRRLRTDMRSQSDVGAEIIAKSAVLATLEGVAFNGAPKSLDFSGAAVLRSTAVMLPEDGQLNTRASVLLEPGTNAPGQTFTIRYGDVARQATFGHTTEWLDGWQRVEIDWVD